MPSSRLTEYFPRWIILGQVPFAPIHSREVPHVPTPPFAPTCRGPQCLETSPKSALGACQAGSAVTPVGVAWRDLFPTLAGGDAQTGAIMETAHQLTLPPDQPVFRAGSPCLNYVLLLAGQVRVQIIGEGGREAVLYRVLTTCCILAPESGRS